MFPFALFSPLGLIELILGAVTFSLLLRSKNLTAYWPLLVVTLWGIVPGLLLAWLRAFRYLSAIHAYNLYFYCYWISFAAAAFCSGLVTYTIFQEALKPLKGLQSLGDVMFVWIVAITAALTFSVAIEPHQKQDDVILRVASELQLLSGVVVLGLVTFVLATVRPLGLTVRSRVFGVSAGICIATAANVWVTPWVFSRHALVNSYVLDVACCASQMIWIWYFSVPEPQRNFVMLPTTSPFHQWNLVSERMGYDPGMVAIAGVPPSAFTEAEMTIFERIADQDSGRAPRLKEVEVSENPLYIWTAETVHASEKFSKAWDFLYESRSQQAPLSRTPPKHLTEAHELPPEEKT